jgi:hypothetical protein
VLRAGAVVRTSPRRQRFHAPAGRRQPPSEAPRPAQPPSPTRLGYGGICRAAQPGSGAEEIERLLLRCHRPASWEEVNPGRRLPGDRTNAQTSAGGALQSATPWLQIEPLPAGCETPSPRCLNHIRRPLGSTTLAGFCAPVRHAAATYSGRRDRSAQDFAHFLLFARSPRQTCRTPCQTATAAGVHFLLRRLSGRITSLCIPRGVLFPRALLRNQRTSSLRAGLRWSSPSSGGRRARRAWRRR